MGDADDEHFFYMAKFGEGDERWIVKEREDGANVNNWHWAEKNLTAWSEQRLRELLVGVAGLEEATGKGFCKITELEKMEGAKLLSKRWIATPPCKQPHQPCLHSFEHR